MFNIDAVKHLQTLSSRPSVTITLPTYRTAPDNHKDPIRLKNLVTEAVNRLESEFGKREVAALITKLNAISDDIDHTHNLDGLILMVSNEYQGVFKVPYRLPERVAIDDNFLTRDIVFAMNRTPLYWVLMLSEKPTRLYLGRKTDLHEVREFGFPHEYNGPGTGVTVQSGIGANPSREKDRALEAFMRDVDSSLTDALKAGDYPVVVVGLAQNLSSFRGVSRNGHAILQEVEGGHDSLSVHDLGQVVWPHTRDALSAQRQDIFGEVEQAVGQNRFVSDLNEAWQAAQDGRVATMVVQENLHLPAQVSTDGRSLTLLETGKEAGQEAYADAVDEMIEFVMQAGGKVRFVDDDQLGEHDGLVMLTRY